MRHDEGVFRQNLRGAHALLRAHHDQPAANRIFVERMNQRIFIELMNQVQGTRAVKRIFIELMTTDRKQKASREGSK